MGSVENIVRNYLRQKSALTGQRESQQRRQANEGGAQS